MLLQYFGFRVQPFGNTPDPRFLFAQGPLRDALTELRRGIERGPRVQMLIADPGLGKTTVLFALREALEPHMRVAFLCNTLLTGFELLGAVCKALDSSAVVGNTLDDRRNALETMFRSRKINASGVVIILDEAQDLESSAVAELGALMRAAPDSVRLILSGQPDLVEKLRHPATVPWRQIKPITLMPLTRGELERYVHEQLRIAGYPGLALFTTPALNRIYSLSGGIPRLVNRYCTDALDKAFTLGKRLVDRDLLEDPVDYNELANALERVLNRDPEPSPAAASLVVPSGAPDTSPPQPAPKQTLPSTSSPPPISITQPQPRPAAAIADPIASAVHAWLSRRAAIWNGTAGELLASLHDDDPQLFGAMSSKDFTQMLTSKSVELQAAGVEVVLRQNPNGPRMIALKLLEGNHAAAGRGSSAKSQESSRLAG